MQGIEYSFEKLKVWNEAKELVVNVYHLLDSFPMFEKFALCDQIRRAIVSVPSNIAEGSGRKSLKEKTHFLEISYGSLMETYNQLLIAIDAPCRSAFASRHGAENINAARHVGCAHPAGARLPTPKILRRLRGLTVGIESLHRW